MTTTTNWEKEFNKRFTYLDENGERYLLGGFDKKKGVSTDNIPAVKAFIRTLLAQQRQELLNLVEILIDEQEWISTGGDFLKFVAKGIAPQEELRQKLSALRLSIKKKV